MAAGKRSSQERMPKCPARAAREGNGSNGEDRPRDGIEMEGGDETLVLSFYASLQQTSAAKVIKMKDMAKMECQGYKTAVSELERRLTNSVD